MIFNSYADSAGLPPMNSPPPLYFCPPHEPHDSELYASLSPNQNKVFEHSTANFPFELPLPERHEFSSYPFTNPVTNLNEYQDLGYSELNFSNQIDTHHFSDPQSLFSTPPPYGQSSPFSPRLSNSSIEYTSSPNFSPADTTTSIFLPPGLAQFTQLGNECSYLEPEHNVPLLNLQTTHNPFFSNLSEVPLLQREQVWRPTQATQEATPTPEPKSKRKASSLKSTRPLPASTDSNSTPIVSSSQSKSQQAQRPKRSSRSSHLILTDSPVSVTQGGYARKYACTWEGCGKAFTTSGHLVRHKRIHTGEKRYECAMENCSSRFSRQDNMLQHYRTHFSSKSRRISSLSSVPPNHSPQNSYPPITDLPALVLPQLTNFGQIFGAQNSFKAH